MKREYSRVAGSKNHGLFHAHVLYYVLDHVRGRGLARGHVQVRDHVPDRGHARVLHSVQKLWQQTLREADPEDGAGHASDAGPLMELREALYERRYMIAGGR